MYETYLQNEREWEEKNHHVEKCACTGRKCQFHSAHLIPLSKVKSHNRLSLIKVMKALEKELEGEIEEAQKYPLITDGKQDYIYNLAYEKGLNFSLDKIREFISKLEQQ